MLALLLFSCGEIKAKVWSPGDMPNVQVSDRNQYVSDPAGLLSSETLSAVNEKLASLRQSTTAEVVVALPPDIGDTPIEEWSEQLFTLWGIGKKDKDNGVLIVIAPEQRKARIQTGYGAEGVLPDISCANIIGRAIVPAMREGNIDMAVSDAVNMVSDAMTDPAVAEELRSSETDNFESAMTTISPEVIWGLIRIVAWVVFLFALVSFIRDLVNSRKEDNYHKALLWRQHLPIYFWCGILSLGASFIFFIISFWLYRSIRTKRRKCPHCGEKMRRLNEEEDNALLTPSQDFEEKLKTVDYDVWACPRCATVERLPFKAKQMRYTKCPSCGTIAMCLSGARVIRPATTRSQGAGIKTYECKFCHHKEERPYVIPKKDDGTGAAVVAGAILGSANRGGHGGGGFGGGFGGGSTGGGGASGGW